MSKLWVDDRRTAPDGWDWAKTYWEAIDLLSEKDYETVSFDHDLGCFRDGREYTGYDVAVWIEERALDGGFVPKEMLIHTDNPSGRRRLVMAIKAIERRRSGTVLVGR